MAGPTRWDRAGHQAALLAVACLLLVAAAPALARAGLRVQVQAPPLAAVASPGDTTGARHTSPDTLVASFALHGLFDEEDRTLAEGVPATLTLVVDLWRERSGWWDPLVHSRAYTYRFRRDIWTNTYEALNPDGSTTRLPDADALRAHLERVHEVPLGPPSLFEPGKRYYLTVKAVLRPLDLDDLEEVNAWLSGDVTGGENGGVLGLPRALARMAVNLSGLGDRTAVGRSVSFVPRPRNVRPPG